MNAIRALVWLHLSIGWGLMSLPSVYWRRGFFCRPQARGFLLFVPTEHESCQTWPKVLRESPTFAGESKNSANGFTRNTRFQIGGISHFSIASYDLWRGPLLCLNVNA